MSLGRDACPEPREYEGRLPNGPQHSGQGILKINQHKSIFTLRTGETKWWENIRISSMLH
jgi:hypothetical protein